MRSLRGIASHLLVASVAAAAGMLGTWALRQQRAAPPSPGAVTTHGEWIRIGRGADTLRAYIAFPERRDKAPAVIVIHEVFGLTGWEPTVVDRLAENGYVALVPDMLSSRWGISPPSADSARKLMGQLAPEGITADLEAAYAYLEALPAVRADRIGVIGFCWGGGQTFRYATVNPKLKAAVVCYGPAADSAAMERIATPILGIYGENDARVNAALPTVARQMSDRGKRFVFDSYPGTGHGFLKPGRRGYDTEQPARAWAAILSFFRTELEQ